MLIKQYQRVILLTAGLWFIGGFGFAHADNISVKSKALAYYIMAVVDDLNGENQLAIREYEKAAKFDRHQSMPHLRLGAYYARLGRFKEAIHHLNIVLKLQPESTQARYLLALIYSSQNKYELSIEQYQLVLKNKNFDNVNQVDVHSYLSQLYFALKKYPEVLEQIGQVLKYQPRNVSALFLQGSAYLELNQKEQAKDVFRQILAIDPNHDAALNSLAYVYAEEGTNLEEAQKMAKKAVELDPSNGAYCDTLGWVLYKLGFYAESLMSLEKAGSHISDPIIYDHMGDVYLASKEPALARKSWLKSLELSPRQTNVAKKIEQLNKTSAKNQDFHSNTPK